MFKVKVNFVSLSRTHPVTTTTSVGPFEGVTIDVGLVTLRPWQTKKSCVIAFLYRSCDWLTNLDDFAFQVSAASNQRSLRGWGDWTSPVAL